MKTARRTLWKSLLHYVAADSLPSLLLQRAVVSRRCRIGGRAGAGGNGHVIRFNDLARSLPAA